MESLVLVYNCNYNSVLNILKILNKDSCLKLIN